MATYREGWEDAARYFAALLTMGKFDADTRKRLYNLASVLLDISPDVPPPPDAEWRAKVPLAVEAKKDPRKPAPAEPEETHKP